MKHETFYDPWQSILFSIERLELNPDLASTRRGVFRVFLLLFARLFVTLHRALVLNFGDGETTDIISIEHSALTTDHSDEAWYTIDGRRLAAQPTARGIYIYKGRKIAIQ